MAERVHFSETAAWGTVLKGGELGRLRVEMQIKGEEKGLDGMAAPVIGFRGYDGIKSGMEVLVLKGTEQPSNQGSIAEIYQGSDDYRVLQVLADPGEAMAQEELGEIPELSEYLGFLFKGGQVECELGEEVGRMYEMGFEERVPWNLDRKIPLVCESRKGWPGVKLLSQDVEVEHQESFRGYIQFTDLGGLTDKLPTGTKFEMTIDARKPKVVMGITREEAITFLNRRIKKENPNLAMTAISALRRMRCSKGGKVVGTLLNELPTRDFDQEQHKGRRFVSGLNQWTADYLGFTRSSESLKFLERRIANLDRNDEQFLVNAGPVSRAIGRHEGERVKGLLEGLAAEGEELACYGLALHGDRGSAQVLIDAMNRRRRYPMSATHAMQILVARSNLAAAEEPWMTTNNGLDAEKSVPKWLAWWETHKEKFKIERSMRDVNRR